MVRDSIKQENAEVFYRDKVGKDFEYVKGVVVEYKSVKDAAKHWDQHWKRKRGTILKIVPKDSKVNEKGKARYRHMSSVLSPEQYHHKYNSDTRKK